uniref:FAS1 domain-containing protein n=2 Tax=Oryza brachyantha TaxID=4533 RepID=J3KUT7_ORYBR
MARKDTTSAVVLLGIIALLASSAAAFNITRILGELSDFSTFNNLLMQKKLADEINRRQTITVLAVDNGAAGGISSLPSDVQRKVLSVHVVLDYYDTKKLNAMKNHSTRLTTLFQSSGQATNHMGFLNCTKHSDGTMVFGSAEPGAPVTSQLVKLIASRPYNISVLQVSSAIVPPSIGTTNANNSKADAPLPALTKAKTPISAPAPSASKGKKGASSPKQDVRAPGPSNNDASADTPSDTPGPLADGPTADGPSTNGPTADGPTEADAPADDKSDAADAPKGSAGNRAVAGVGLGIVALLVITFSF